MKHFKRLVVGLVAAPFIILVGLLAVVLGAAASLLWIVIAPIVIPTVFLYELGQKIIG
jgi:p-aminobenzoyl-glutamate transporter AbgT